jgi:uncharacterized protein (DUF58 family)
MIIPRKIVFLSGIFIPLALALPYAPILYGVISLMLALLAIVALFDLAKAVQLGRAMKLSVPEVVRCSQSRKGIINFQFDNTSPSPVYIDNFCHCLPLVLNAVNTADTIKLASNSISTLPVECCPETRGSFEYGNSIFEIRSPWGLWGFKAKIRPQGEIKVYPDVFTEQKKLASLFLNKGLSGLHLQRIAGQGREFERLRDYVPGDSFDIISWKATARKARPVSKVFQIENTQSIYAVIDASRFSMVKKDGKSNLDHYLASALILGAVAQKQKDKFGIIVFDSKVRSFVPAMSGAIAAKNCRDAVYKVEAKCVSPDYNSLFSFIRAKIPQRSLLFFLTDLSDALPGEEFQRDIQLVTRKHLCCVEMLKHDDIEPLFSSPIEENDELYTKLGGHMKWADLENIKRSLSRHGVRLGTSGHESLSLNLVNAYLNIKRKQLL